MSPRHLGYRYSLVNLLDRPKYIPHTIDFAWQHIARQNPLPTPTRLASSQPDADLTITISSALQPTNNPAICQYQPIAATRCTNTPSQNR